jgi:hypothetical protein
MSVSERTSLDSVIHCAAVVAGLLIFATSPLASEQPGPPKDAAPAIAGQLGRDSSRPAPACNLAQLGSPFIPVDSWVYPAMLRLYGLGFVDHVFLGMRPWTRTSVDHMLEQAGMRIEDADAGPATDEAQDIYEALMRYVRFDIEGPCLVRQAKTHFESVYTTARAISGTPLRDSYHLGSTIINDYGRPYASGFDSYTGASGYVGAGRFTLYARGEFQGSPSATGYSATLAQTLSNNDLTTYTFSNAQNSTTMIPLNQLATIPYGPIGATTTVRVVEAYASVQYLSHVISFGKQDDWLGPGLGGGMAYSNNAENIYSFRINRIEPLRIPLLSRLTGPFRYDFIVGELKGHVYPADPWVHVEQISFRPTENLEFGFERTVIWGGKNHEPVNIKSFLRSFFSLTAAQSDVKYSRSDPGARFGSFNFSYRLPFVRNWLTLYTDSEVHDDISPADAPRRGSWRPGLYLSHVPGVPKLDIRAEGVYTDPPTSRSNFGTFMYWESVQREGYTNKGVLFGDWIGREDKGGQAWVTYHFSGNEWFQVGARNQKAAKDFIPGGTTLNDINFQVVKRIGKDFEINGNFALEKYKAPIYQANQQTVTTTTIQLTWFPQRRTSF